MEAGDEIRFDGWTLLRPSGELLHEGRRTRLQSHPLKVLEALLERPGELVTREQLIARLWPQQVVDFDIALNAAVRRLRKALGDEADTPRYVETIPRRGYRFIAAVDVGAAPGESPASEPEAIPPQARRLRALAPLAVLAALALLAGGWLLLRDHGGPARDLRTAAEPRSIVVLPFVSLAAGDEARFLADGLTEELIHRLTGIRGLQVIARTSSFALRGEKHDIAAVARQLNVSHVLEGSVRRSSGRIRVTAQLIDAASGTHLWSRNYDRAAGDTFAIQDDIAAQVARALAMRLEPQAVAARRPDPAAYDKYMVARYLFGRRGPGEVARAREYFMQATDLDPSFAQAWAGLASASLILTWEEGLDREVGVAEVRRAAHRALELDPSLAEPHFRLANVERFTGDAEAAAAHRRKAIELEPDHPLALSMRADEAREAGRMEEFIALYRRLIAMDPLATGYRANFAWELLGSGRYEESLAEMRKLGEMSPVQRLVECQALVLLGRFDEARDVGATMEPPEDSMQCVALAQHGLGDRAASDAALGELVAREPDAHAYMAAVVHAYRGDSSAAFDWLGRNEAWCRRTGSVAAQCFANVVERSPFLAPLRADPRWSTAGLR